MDKGGVSAAWGVAAVVFGGGATAAAVSTVSSGSVFSSWSAWILGGLTCASLYMCFASLFGLWPSHGFRLGGSGSRPKRQIGQVAEIGPSGQGIQPSAETVPGIPADALRIRLSGELGAESSGWRRDALVDAVRARLAAGPDPIVLCGLPGIGKTVAMAEVVEEIAGESAVLTLRLRGCQPDPRYLVRALARCFGVKAHRRILRSPWPAAFSQLLASRADGSLVVMIDGVDPEWAAADLVAFWSQMPNTLVLATARTQPPEALPCQVLNVGPLSRPESLGLIQHQLARFALPGSPERIAGALPEGVLSHPGALSSFLAHLLRTPIGLLLAAPGFPADVGDSLRPVSEIVSAFSGSDRRCLAFSVVLNGAKQTDVRAAGLALPADFAAALDRLARNCVISTSDDCVEAPGLVAEALAGADPQCLEQVESTVGRGLRAAITGDDTGIDVTLSRVLPPVVIRLVKTKSWATVRQIIDPRLLDRLNERGHWEAYVQMTRLLVEAMDHLGDSADAVIMRCRLARKLGQQGDLDSAWTLLQTAQDMIGDDGSAVLQAMLCQHRAMLAYLQNDDQSALADTRASAALYADAGDAEGVLQARKLEGNVLLRQGDYQGAADTYQMALGTDEFSATVKHRLEVETSLSLCEMRLGMADMAEQRLKRILRQMRESRIDSELPRVLLTSALLAEQRGRFADALQFARRAAAGPAPHAAVRMAAERLVWRLERFGQRTAETETGAAET